MKLDEVANKAAENNGGVKNSDEFYTPDYAITPLLQYLKPNSRIWCPFDTDQSNFVKLLKQEGHTVTNSHLAMGVDFFTEKADSTMFDYIISNPPYSLKKEVFEHLFKLNIPFAMLVGVVGLFESKERFNLFKNNAFEIMYFDKRVSYFKNYDDPKPSLNPPFSSVYITKDILPETIVFETIEKSPRKNKK